MIYPFHIVNIQLCTTYLIVHRCFFQLALLDQAMLLPPHVGLFSSYLAVRSAFSVETFTVFFSIFRGANGLLTSFSYDNAQPKPMPHKFLAAHLCQSETFHPHALNIPHRLMYIDAYQRTFDILWGIVSIISKLWT